MNCCRCGARTKLDSFGNGSCLRGMKDRTCGHWWRRDGHCRWNWTAGANDLTSCPGACGWDHALFFTATKTTPEGQEHRFHAPGSGVHRPLAVVRPHGAGRRLSEIILGPVGDGREHPATSLRLERIYAR